VFRVDHGANAALFLRLRDDLQGQGGLAGRLRPVDLDDSATRQPANPKAMSSEIDPVGMTKSEDIG
jgi:hypothetical protein